MTCLAWAQEAPGSNPGAPTKQLFCFYIARNTTVHPYFTCENSAGRRSDFANPLIRRTSQRGEQTKNKVRSSAKQK